MTKRLLQWALLALVWMCAVGTAQAQVVTRAPITTVGTIGKLGTIGPIFSFPFPWVITSKCVHYDGRACASGELADPYYKQVFVTSAGFAEAERSGFWTEFDRIVGFMTNGGGAWSTQYRERLLFVGYFVPGGPLGSDTAAFGAKIAEHPIRGFATSLSQQAVYDKVAAIAAREIVGLRPFAAGVLFNSYQAPVTANAAPPSFVQRPFGVCELTRGDLDTKGTYITTHEMAHAGLNLLDEYVEQGFENLSIRQLDALTPLALFDWSWGGFIDAISDLLDVYDYNISEILAANGNDNITLSSWPATVSTPGWATEYYPYEHGMFFGRGTFHMAGKNVMNSERLKRAADDGFAQAHSAGQQRVINQVFAGGAGRPNDRLRNAGPKDGWKAEFGDSTHVMLYDGDKNHHFQPTRSYTVQVGWYDRQWHTCWEVFVPYPCYDDVWTTAQKQVTPTRRAINLQTSSLYGLANLTQSALCAVGINEIPKGDGSTDAFRLCDQDLGTVSANFLPTVSFTTPYQDVAVPASQWLTTYWWRFSTNNGFVQSGWTGWSSFYRSL